MPWISAPDLVNLKLAKFSHVSEETSREDVRGGLAQARDHVCLQAGVVASMFGLLSKPEGAPHRVLVGDWRAETHSGQVTSVIAATYAADGAFLIRTEISGTQTPPPPTTQAGRYRTQTIDKRRFKLHLLDDDGRVMSTSVRTIIDRNTMVSDLGKVTFHRHFGD
jgi:hypothetical protein